MYKLLNAIKYCYKKTPPPQRHFFQKPAVKVSHTITLLVSYLNTHWGTILDPINKSPPKPPTFWHVLTRFSLSVYGRIAESCRFHSRHKYRTTRAQHESKRSQPRANSISTSETDAKSTINPLTIHSHSSKLKHMLVTWAVRDQPHIIKAAYASDIFGQ